MNAKKLSLVLSSALALGILSTFGGDVLAAETANLAVSASVTANCTITTTALAFGSYDPVVTNKIVDKVGTGGVNITCTSGSAPYITLGQGANPFAGSSPAVPLRQMISGADLLKYLLYTNEARSTVWGDTEATGVSDTGTGLEVSHIVYGSITAGQNAPVGTYADTVIATVTF